jgi:3-methyl-2-oxobutanoate hydroxymethyltransferase
MSARKTVLTLAEMRRSNAPITMVTAYDYPGARAAEAAEVDAILVGDSLAMVVLGHPNTLSVTLDEMLHHARAVARGATTPLLIGDLPFMSYQIDAGRAVASAGRFVQEAGMAAVKLEGGRGFSETVRAIVRAGIPVIGHLGLTPQSLNVLGGFRVQGRTAEAACRLLDDARALEDAGCFAIVLESVPERLATHITDALEIPTIGIGAGTGTSGQVLVYHDLLGLCERSPSFARRYAELGDAAVAALARFRDDVRQRAFPAAGNAYSMPDDEWRSFLAATGEAYPRPVTAKR